MDDVAKKVIANTEGSLKDKARKMFDLIYNWKGRYHPRIAKVLDGLNERWNNLTLFYLYPEIPKTNNVIEHYFAETNPERIKKRFKTDVGLDLHLKCKAFFKRLLPDVYSLNS